jgi:hypothetical protein
MVRNDEIYKHAYVPKGRSNLYHPFSYLADRAKVAVTHMEKSGLQENGLPAHG